MPYPTNEELNRYRPIPFYYLTDSRPEALTYQNVWKSLSKLQEQGYGGVIIFNRPPTGFNYEEYFSERWFETVEKIIECCKELGLVVWINDDYDAPPGDVGRRLEKIAPECRPQRLRLKDGKVVPEDVSWGFPSFLESKSSELFIKLVYEGYKKRFGKYFGNVIKGFFSDADARQVNFLVLYPNSEMRDYFPWSDDFERSFKEKFGYEIVSYLSAILRRDSIPQVVDYWQHASDLYWSWFENNYRWCQLNGLEYTYHTSNIPPWPLSVCPWSSVYAQGHELEGYRYCDYPGTDHEMLDLNSSRLSQNLPTLWFPRVSWGGDDTYIRPNIFFDVWGDLRAKEAASVCFLYDRKGVMCEMYAATTWSACPAYLRNILSWQIMQGVTFVVHQSYHYRLFGVTKNFAPFSFSAYTEGLREFCDLTTEYACLAGTGILKADFAVLEISRAVWADQTDGKLYRDVCFALNRVPHGYMIADIPDIKRKAASFHAVVNPGLSLSKEMIREFEELGLQVIDAQELLEPGAAYRFVPIDIRYEGQGMPHFLRRETLDGERVMIANIESPTSITGILEIYGKKYNLTLESGEIAFFAPDFQIYHKAGRFDCMDELASLDTAEVYWEGENVIPMEGWNDEEGRLVSRFDVNNRKHFLMDIEGYSDIFTVANQPTSNVLYFPFEVRENTGPITLRIAKVEKDVVENILLDGKPLPEPYDVFLFDDPYLAYPLPGADFPGRHEICLKVREGQVFSKNYCIYLSGEFDVDFLAESPFYDFNCGVDVIKYLPQKSGITLSKRRRSLLTGISWTEQGQPFYSGAAIYKAYFHSPENASVTLILSGARDVCTVTLDGKELGTIVCEPYEWNLGKLEAGMHFLEIRVANTPGNLIYGYRAPSGLTGGIKLLKE
jgi:hypothetical protein